MYTPCPDPKTYQKRKHLDQPRQAKCSKAKKKALFPFIRFGLFDPEGLGAAAGRIKSGSTLISPDRQMFQSEKKAGFPFIL
ncbi:hypothetical protein FZC80_21225 [Rossellomorea aquimaris]|uniref:Uncharacterized protein n=1 Tax=Rossellomorea aquimaris TaxID=189382 RepID=A0A5D4T8P9_9BACI|nr:hypothetical protein FZC80_21225 [Rossellomorea aquimaris]